MNQTEAPAHEAIAHLTRLTELVTQRREQLARRVDLTVAQWRVLETISDEHFMPSMFARERALSPAAVSNTLRQLQDKGLVSARIDADDGRQRRYALTAKGRRTLGALRAHRERAIEAVWGAFPPRDLARFTEFAGALIGRLEQHAESEEE